MGNTLAQEDRGCWCKTRYKQTHNNQTTSQEELNSLETYDTEFIKNKTGVVLSSNDVSACHTFPGKKEIPDIILRVANQKTKLALLRNAKLLKGTRVFFNEH